MELEHYDRFSNFHDWQTVAIECGYEIVVGVVGAIYAAYDPNDEESERGLYSTRTNTGWLEY